MKSEKTVINFTGDKPYNISSIVGEQKESLITDDGTKVITLYIPSSRFIEENKDMKQKAIDAAIESQNKAQLDSENRTYQKEFSRYKQDCRKRALELAYNRSARFGDEIEQALGIAESIKDNEGEVHTAETLKENVLMALADKYYNWLISIPNE